MFRVLCVSVVVLLLGARPAGAEQIKGTVQRLGVISITVAVAKDKDEERTFEIAKDVKVLRLQKKNQIEFLSEGMAAVKVGEEVTIYTSKLDDKELVTWIELTLPRAKKK